MNRCFRKFRLGTISFVLLLAVAGAHEAQGQRFSVEIDPIPYAFGGFSAGGGMDTDAVGYELEVFGLNVPEFFHGNEGFTQYALGTSVRADYYFSGTDCGLFVGVDLDLSSRRFTRIETGNEKQRMQFSTGLGVGYKLPITDHLYAEPWAGAGYTFDADDVVIDGETFEQKSVRVFPALNIGWEF